MSHRHDMSANQLSAINRTPERIRGCLKPTLASFSARRARFRYDDAAEIVETRGWRAHLRFAMTEAGETQVSLAHALGKPQQHVSRLLDPRHKRALTLDWLELMRERAPECWRWFMWAHTEGKAG